MIADMLLAHAQRAAWMPVSPADKAAVLAELHTVLASSHFCNSKRYPALLRYLVEHALEGNTSQIKERTLGIEVFGRPATYDTNSDTIVRYTASEVRRRLATYYHEHDESLIEIVLPAGSYVPDFLHTSAEPETEAIPAAAPLVLPVPQMAQVSAPLEVQSVIQIGEPVAHYGLAAGVRRVRRWPLMLGVAMLLVAALALWTWHAHRVRLSATERFWQPLVNESKPPLIVAGGNIFSNNLYSGTETATRGVDYPFVSMQIASAMARVSGLVQREGKSIDIQAANATMLNDLRDRPIVLIGGYNNDWTVRLASTLPLRLGPAISPSIEEAAGSRHKWERDRSQPYSSADDYALIGRYRDTVTGSMTVIMAGIGRNGSEAAAEFLTNPRHLQELERYLGHPIDSTSFEAVLHVRVIQGRTGAPTILTARTW